MLKWLKRIIKGSPDWHKILDSNFGMIEDKLKFMADCTYDNETNAFTMSFLNVPDDSFVDELPGNLPLFFSVITKMPTGYTTDAVIIVGNDAFTPKYASFESGDVVVICFDNEEKRCFFRTSGGSTGGSSAENTQAVLGSSFLGIAYLEDSTNSNIAPLPAFLRTESGELVRGAVRLESGEIAELVILPVNNG